MSSDKLDTAALAEVLAYLLENEQQHYEESGKPDDHIYAKALHCALQLQRIEEAVRLTPRVELEEDFVTEMANAGLIKPIESPIPGVQVFAMSE